MTRQNKAAGLNEAEVRVAQASDDGRGRVEEAMFAARMAGASIEVSGPAYVVAAVVAAVHQALKDF